MESVRTTDPQSLSPGTEVAVRTHYQEHWARGFEIDHGDENLGYVLRRRSDGALLPTRFSVKELASRDA